MKGDAATFTAASPADWSGPGAARAGRRAFSWPALLWALLYPVKRHRISMTVSGIFLIGLAMGIGTAAYNTASNILFITLSLLLACLLLSGLLSWFNLRGVRWRLRSGGPWRAGHETLVTVEVGNMKAWLPTYGLWFDLSTHAVTPEPAPAEKPEKVSEALAAAERAVTHGRVLLRERLAPRAESAVEWVHRPERRGEAVLELEAVGSLFPFGFLRKSVGTGLRQRVRVWPAQIDYRWHGAAAPRAQAQGSRTARAGTGEDLLALRKYASGDSHRLVHWKASARLGRLMVRQFAAESVDGFALRFDTPAERWPRPEQFELACRFVATLAEDLFAEGRLRGVGVNGAWIETRRLRDVEAVLDLLALVEPVAADKPGRPAEPSVGARLVGDDSPYHLAGRGLQVNRNLITFAPEGARGVAAHVDGILTASA